MKNYKRYLFFTLFVLQTYIMVLGASKPHIAFWQFAIMAATSSGFLAAAFTKPEKVETNWFSLPRFRLMHLFVFTTSLCTQLVTLQALRR